MKNIPLYDVRPINNLKDMLESSSKLYSNEAAFLVKDKENNNYIPITYSQFKSDVDAFGTALIDMGLKGKRIALIGESRYEWTVAYMATLNGTGIIVPLDRELPQNEIEKLVERSEASAIIFSGKYSNRMLDISTKFDFVTKLISMDSSEDENNIASYKDVVSKGYELLKGGNNSFIKATIDNDSMSVLLFTSGTTASSKAVMLSHRNISSNLMGMCSMLNVRQSDIFLSVLPMHHTYECTCGFLCPIYRGSTVAFCEGLRHIAKNLKESKATFMLGVPLILEAIYKRIWDQAAKEKGMLRKLKFAIKLSNFLKIFRIDLTKTLFKKIHDNFGGNLRLFVSGAAGIDPIVAKGFRSLGIHCVQGYGLTECSPIAALNRDVDYKDDAAGIPLPNLEIAVDSPNKEGVGEIIVKGHSVMLGYFEDPEANKSLKDGWFHTGDLGYIDSDKFVHITGRKKNVIITKNGKNIYPEEIETILNRSIYILESLVLAKDDKESGDQILSAVIVPDSEKIQEDYKGETLTHDFIRGIIKNEIKDVNGKLVNYKHIKDFTLRNDEFSKTTTKKIKRYAENNKA